MGRVLKWVVAGLLVIGLVVPRSAYACSPAPDRWEVSITGITPDNPSLPDGVSLESKGATVILRNRTLYNASILSYGVPLITAAPNSHALMHKSQRYLFIEGAERDMIYYEEPSLPPKIVLIIEHRSERYMVLADVAYDIKFMASDPNACSLIGFFSLDMLVALGVLTVVAAIIVVPLWIASRANNRNAA